MSVDLLKEARNMGVHLYLSNNKLKVRANKGALTSELRAKIVASKDELISLLQELESVSSNSGEDTINLVADRVQGLPLSFAQQRMWFIDQLEENSTQYNIPMALKLTGDLDLDAFQAAMNDLVVRHEILRTTYSKTEQGPVQYINPARPVLIKQHDLSNTNGVEQHAQFKALAKAEADSPFDLNKDLMLRVALVKLADDQFNLLFTLHHIAADGWSMGLLARDFGALYRARLQATDSGLPPLDVQYADFANWQRSRLDGDKIDAQFAFWQEQLKALPELHNLPLDFPRPPQQSFEGDSHIQVLSPELASRLNALAIESGTTLYVLMRCALAVLLARWSNEQDIVIAGPLAGRTNGQIEELIGCFINTLVFRHNVELNKPFNEFLKSVNELSMQCMDNQDIQFDQLVERLKPERNLAYSPLFQIIFTFQNNEAAHMELPGLQLEAVEDNEKVIRFDLQLTATESANGIKCDWRYVTKLFSAQSIERLARAYETLLEGILDNTQPSLAALPLINESEQQQLQSFMAEDKAPSGTYADIVPELFARFAAANPEQIAVADNSEELTYAQLDAKSNQLAHALLAHGIQNSVPVAICIERSTECLVAILATWKAGAAYLPLAPEHPTSRLQHQLKDSGCQLLLTQSSLVHKFDDVEQSSVIRIEIDDTHALNGYADTAPEVKVKPEDLAYVIYTSGSTGKAKGVCIEHRNLAHLAANMESLLGRPKNWGWIASYVFDASLQAISRIAYGGTLSIYTSPHKLDAQEMAAFLEQHKVDLLDCTASMVEAWFELGLEAQLPDLVIGGEPISESLWNKLVSWQARFERRAFNVYGPTECCVNATWTRITQAQPHIGRALGATQLRVLDQDGEQQPIGVVGELFIGGPSVARGYLNRAALTDEKFITLQDGQRYYQTGDLVRWTNEGNLEFIKRVDDQLKIRGYRVEPGEIENALTNNDGVREAMVMQPLDEQGSKRNDLAAYCLVDTQTAPAASRILSMLEAERIKPEDLIEVPNGMAICGVNKSETLSIYDEIFVANVYERHGVKIEEGQVIFDVGANIGVFGTSLTTRFETLEVYSFEPIPDTYRRLEANVEIYGNGRNHIHCLGLSDQPKFTEFDYYPYNTALSGISKDEAAPLQVVKQYMLNTNKEKGIAEHQVEDFVQERLEKRKVQVELSTVSEQIRNYGISHIDLLKIDVERSELDVLRGIEESDWPKIKQVVIEIHDEDGALGIISEMLSKQGFDVYVDEEQELKDTGLYNIFAIRSCGRDHTPTIVRNEEKWRSVNTLCAALQDNLEEQLPEYMVPKSIVLLNQYPLTQNGKIDKNLLTSKYNGVTHEDDNTAPRTPLESTLCDIWQNLLKVDNLSIHDNFFARGGDSILSIQAVARAKKAGIEITTRQLFDKQTIAELAKVAKTATAQSGAKSKLDQDQQATGTLQLLPIQKQFFNDDADAANHFNQWLLLTTPQGFNAEKLRQLCEAVYQRHDVLRLRFVKSGENWQASYTPYSDSMLQQSIVIEALPDDEAQWSEHITARCQFYQRSLNIVDGPLFKLVYLDGGAQRQGRLFLVAHHLIVDGVSWRILLEDIEFAYGQLQQNKAIALSSKTASFQQWSDALYQAASEEVFDKELDYWLSQQSQNVPTLPFDIDSDEKATHATTQRTSLRLDAALTEGLLKQCSNAYGTKINELLLSAVYLALRNWQQQSVFMLTLEGHGREDIFDDIDTSQTMGWFTSAYPLVLHCEDETTSGVIKAIKDKYRAIPNNGIGYGVLCELSEQRQLTPLKHADISFNYLGQFDQSVNTESAFVVAPEHTGDAIDPNRMRAHCLGLTGMVAGGELEFIIDFSSQQFSHKSINALSDLLSDALREIVSHCQSIHKTVLTCSDFPLATLSQAQIDKLQTQYAIENLYPATPMQKGMIFHSALEYSAYVSQVTLVFNGELKTDLFRKSWESALAKYDIFRTAFVGSGESLHQLVSKEVKLDWHQEVWSDLAVQEKHTRFTTYQRQDKAKGFDLANAPLMRLAVFELAPRRFQLLWSFHHTIMDGWSTPLVYKEVMNTYQALLQGQSVPDANTVPYQKYIQWLTSQDQQQGVNYWRDYLNGFEQPTPLLLDKIKVSEEQGYRKQTLDVGESFTAQLEQFARSRSTTVNTLLQLGLGLVLQAYSGTKDVVFGATISGRPAQVSDIESMVGMFINTVPVRINPDQQWSVMEAAQQLQTQFNDSNHFGYLGLTDIHKQTALKGHQSLFDCLLAFENYPIEAQEAVNAEQLPITVEGLESDEQTNYGLTFIVTLKNSLVINCGYNVERFANSSVGMMLNHLKAVLEQLMEVKTLSQIAILNDEEVTLFDEVCEQEKRLAAENSAVDSPAAEENVMPQSTIQNTLAAIWGAVLPQPVESVHSNFFDLGGNSLLALQVAETCQAEGLDLHVALIWKHQTIAAIAQALEEAL
ncbi:non-ribosomal peptide synthetase [Pseudoalteromonas sp. JB197]|uniref:non-ribosomal peptide synthetase n=1 Tax=Pseudoalteromonas sp. JB197 TaxID=1434839 RepID=UPI00097F2ACA|nr:non-ribosomal peptide synthetase [Pseudoalteromonas sp. JB197]PCC14200.1 hypothetical protein CIK86_13655 [Pseudoalteromonas sp. JB197]SJN16525.1 Non-ribosomal peptide synthetase [Pseudoalteromonas sp. JB197]